MSRARTSSWAARFASVAAVALLACGADPGERGATPGADPLRADWLDGGNVITPDHLARVIRLGDGDPQVRPIFAEAQTRLGGGQLEGLARRFVPCPANAMAEGGLTKVQSFDVWVPRPLEEVAFHASATRTSQTIADLEKGTARDSRVVENTDFVVVQRTQLPDICIVPRLTLAEAYEAVVHELIHALRYQPRDRWGMALTPIDERTFQASVVLSPGGEVEAYTVSAGAALRLLRGRILASPLLVAFDRGSGAPLVPPDRLASLILAPQPAGLGYADGLLRGALATSRREIAEDLAMRRQLFETLLVERRGSADVAQKNIDIHQHNIDAHRHNIGVANARGDRALAQRSAAGVAEEEAALVRTRALLDTARVSEARIVPELAEVNEQFDALQRLIAGTSAGPPAPPPPP